MKSIFWLVVLASLCPRCRNVATHEKDPRYWKNLSRDVLNQILTSKRNNNVARNVILFLGDGIGIPTLTAGRSRFKGQQNGQSGEDGSLVWDHFPDVALLKTYTVDMQVPESCSTATAFLCGVKANYYTIGVDARTKLNDCASSKGSELESILQWSQREGLFAYHRMNYEFERDKSQDGQPSLEEMTVKAIEILSRGRDDGYFLLVEGARIDHAHHRNTAHYALEEFRQFEKAVGTALRMTKSSDTLIIVMGDHDQGMKFSGHHQKRGAPITGIAQNSDVDGLPYTSLLYTTGPGFKITKNGTRVDISNEDIPNNTKHVYSSAIPSSLSAHGGEDVAVFATGPMSHLFRGVQEQSYVAYALAYASCVGENKQHCRQ